jgi:hypothetical protein
MAAAQILQDAAVKMHNCDNLVFPEPVGWECAVTHTVTSVPQHAVTRTSGLMHNMILLLKNFIKTTTILPINSYFIRISK